MIKLLKTLHKTPAKPLIENQLTGSRFAQGKIAPKTRGGVVRAENGLPLSQRPFHVLERCCAC